MIELNTVAIIPARLNSKGIHKKNLQKIRGNTLVDITVQAALDSKYIDLVTVTTESTSIEQEVDIEAKVLLRPAELSQDHVQVDEVVLFALRQLQLEGINPDTLVILQPTSPLRTSAHIDEALELYNIINSLNYQEKPFENPIPLVSVWEPGWAYEESGAYGYLESYEWNPGIRLGRQESGDPGIAVENGAIYISDAKLVSRNKTFRFGRVIPYYMDKMSSLEIDDVVDLEVAEVYLKYSNND